MRRAELQLPSRSKRSYFRLVFSSPPLSVLHWIPLPVHECQWSCSSMVGVWGGQAVLAVFVWVSIYHPPPALMLLSSSATIRSDHRSVSIHLKTDASVNKCLLPVLPLHPDCPALCCCFFLPNFSIFNIPNFIISFFIILLLKKCLC